MVKTKDKRKKKQRASTVTPISIAVNIQQPSRRPSRTPDDRMKVNSVLQQSLRNLEVFSRFGRGQDLTLQAGLKNLQNEQENITRKNNEMLSLFNNTRQDLSQLDEQVRLLGKFSKAREGKYDIDKIRWAFQNFPNEATNVTEATKILREVEAENAAPWNSDVSSKASESDVLNSRTLARHNRSLDELSSNDPRRVSLAGSSFSSITPLTESVIEEPIAGAEETIPEPVATPAKRRGRPPKSAVTE